MIANSWNNPVPSLLTMLHASESSMTRIHIATFSEPHGSNVLTQGRDVIASHATQ